MSLSENFEKGAKNIFKGIGWLSLGALAVLGLSSLFKARIFNIIS